jgi:hypothetical protein
MLGVLVAMGGVSAWSEQAIVPFPPGVGNSGQNAVWLDVGWSSEPRTDHEIGRLAGHLRRYQIQHVFAYAGFLREDGRFTSTYGHASDFVQHLKAAVPEVRVQGWIGVPVRRAWSSLTGSRGYVDLGDQRTRGTIASFCADLVVVGGFDGVHLDAEPVADGDQHLLALLEEVRRATGPGATLSVATPHIRPFLVDAPPLAHGPVAWSGGYYRQVARRVDQVAVMTYDSGLPLAGLYRAWQRTQVVRISQVLAGLPLQVFIGVPTSEEPTWTHWPAAETMRTGLAGVLDGLAASAQRVVTGVAIYPYWETDDEEWALYEVL